MSHSSLESLQQLYSKSKEQILNEFFTFLRFKSVSTDPEYNGQLKQCADWVADYVRQMGLQVDIWPTSGHPVIFASYKSPNNEAPTLLIYNHYDVQPIDPIEEWESPPFEPTIRNGEVFARGAQDNKGQCFYTLQAIKALLKRDGSLPINLKLCIEGEEEKGSNGLSQILPSKSKELKADYVAVVDMGIRDMHSPAVTLGVRGITCMELEIQGSKGDLHSGSHGGLAYNPLHAMVELLAKLRDPTTGKVLVPGFYDQVASIDPNERSQLSTEFHQENYQKEFGINPIGGEKELPPLDRVWLRPTIEINGLSGGYSGPGFKTVIPAKAFAKISCRLVPHQDPKKISQLVSEFLKKNAPQGVKLEVKSLSGDGMAVRASPNSPVVKSFSKAYEEVFQKPCKQILSGGSIPVLAELAKVSEGSVVLLGLGLPTDQIHAPNEHFGVDRLEKGFLLIARALEILGEKK